MKLTTYTIGDVLEIKHGYAFSGEHIVTSDNGVVLVTPGNFRIGGGFQEDKCKFYKGDYPAEYVLPAETHIVTMTDLSKEIDTLGYSAIVPASERTYLHNQRIGRIVYKSHNIYPLYMHYLMRTREYQRFVANSSSGATVHHTSPEKICRYEFCAPSRAKQEEIADLLYAYDSLIENNRRQIKLLEEAAQRLYKEWFVDLRFPGHEHTPIVNGIPQGWSVQQLAQIADIVCGQSPSSEYYNTCGEGLPFHQGVGSYGTRFVQDGTYSSVYSKVAPAGSILFSVRAPVGRLNLTMNEVAIGRGLAAMNHKKNRQSFLFYMLKARFFKDDLAGNGSIFASISKNELKKVNFVVPCDALQEQFNAVASSFDSKLALLIKQNNLLTEARDRLLPKLMSGEVEV